MEMLQCLWQISSHMHIYSVWWPRKVHSAHKPKDIISPLFSLSPSSLCTLPSPPLARTLDYVLTMWPYLYVPQHLCNPHICWRCWNVFEWFVVKTPHVTRRRNKCLLSIAARGETQNFHFPHIRPCCTRFFPVPSVWFTALKSEHCWWDVIYTSDQFRPIVSA